MDLGHADRMDRDTVRWVLAVEPQHPRRRADTIDIYEDAVVVLDGAEVADAVHRPVVQAVSGVQLHARPYSPRPRLGSGGAEGRGAHVAEDAAVAVASETTTAARPVKLAALVTPVALVVPVPVPVPVAALPEVTNRRMTENGATTAYALGRFSNV
eukprot:scaffold7377_cov257-Pinguiococcus_pyrenoidosus.AAC.18